MFELPEYSLIAAIIPIAWAIYLKHTTGTGIQIRIINLNYRTTICIRNGSNNTLFIDDALCYKSHRHKYRFYSINTGKSVSISPGEELRLNLDVMAFLDFIKKLNFNKREFASLKIKLYTSREVLSSGWVRLIKNNDSQYGYTFENNPRAIVMKSDLNPVYSEYINPVLAAFIMASILGSFFLSYEIMSFIVIVDLMLILLFGPFTFIRGFKNGATGSLICLGFSFLLSLMLSISANDGTYMLSSMPFFIVIYLEAMICSGGLTLNLE